MFQYEEYEKPYVDVFTDGFYDQLSKLVKEYFMDKPSFSKAISMYRYDEYLLNTAAASSASATIYIEIDAPLNYKLSAKGKEYTYNHDNLKVPALYLPLKTIKDNLYNIMVNSFDSNCTIWKSRYSIMLSTYVEDEDEIKTFYTFNIIPCLTYRNRNGVKGVMYYNDYNSEVNVDYPKQSIINFRIKEKQTEGKLTKAVKALKQTYMKLAKETRLPTEIYEIICYNVPNEIIMKEDLTEMIKYLSKVNLKEFKSIDEQDLALATRNRVISAVYVKHVIKTLERLINK